MTIQFMRRLLVAAALLAGTAANAQTSPSYAIMSMIGDKMTLVIHQIGTGSRLNANRRVDMPMPDDTLDGIAAFAADDAIKRLQPGAKTSLFVTRDPKLLALQDKLADSTGNLETLAQQLKDLVASANATHLLLISKYRADARLRLVDGSIGGGRLTGLGFYVDQETRIVDRETGRAGTGFISPYAYLSVTLFDMTQMRLLRREAATESDVVSPGDSASAVVPWDALTSQQKVDAIKRVTQRAIDAAVPRVLEAR